MHKDTAKEYFDTLKVMFEKCSLIVGAELRRQLNELKLKDGGDARAHINRIISLREELATVGKPVSDKDLFGIILASLPRSYNNIISCVSSSITLHSKTVSCDTLLDLITDKYDHFVIQDPKSKSKSNDDAAFGADSSKKGKGKKERYNGDCGNCG